MKKCANCGIQIQTGRYCKACFVPQKARIPRTKWMRTSYKHYGKIHGIYAGRTIVLGKKDVIKWPEEK